MWKITQPDIACYFSTSEIQGGGHPSQSSNPLQMGNAQVGKHNECSIGVYKDLIVLEKHIFIKIKQ